ncbi:hypothetical protein F909_00367 [Acinetobacter sp. ANC 3929]|uniref:hypothetical protein n=1 Tax=unclassified Acinetobacter TaxID=196816 RepID=UPI0002CF0CD2|nr:MULTISPECIES: hypothetical protein [unclassified Acinetobacter]ENW83706.1 hypothetical protein F909_00367 [Acinetobacter sp. ANC 3929]MCH7353545.1 hypothetical protein [Acinetobacter sp. NIPH 2023]MCH7355982.1 hypothetical protein [Acinetobacter sp. NIPH 1958]MCH7360840.1 hypothetical protein [Acinetobacter sp. NIPH 2024]
MQVVLKSVLALCLLSSTAWAVEPTTPTAATTTTAQTQSSTTTPVTGNATATVAKPLTAEQIAKAKQQQDAKVKAMIQDQASRLKQLEHANLEALSQNQELQLKNDNLTVQVQVLQSERSAQMFLYGAMTIAVGVILGFLIASYIHTKRRRQW